MSHSNPAEIVKNVVGIGGTVLLAPVAPPILHGLAGIAVVGLGLFTAGSLVMKAADAMKGIDNPLKPNESNTPSR